MEISFSCPHFLPCSLVSMRAAPRFQSKTLKFLAWILFSAVGNQKTTAKLLFSCYSFVALWFQSKQHITNIVFCETFNRFIVLLDKYWIFVIFSSETENCAGKNKQDMDLLGCFSNIFYSQQLNSSERMTKNPCPRGTCCSGF